LSNDRLLRAGFLPMPHEKGATQPNVYATPVQALILSGLPTFAVARNITVLRALWRLRVLGAVDRCISKPSKRGRNIAKDPQWSLGKYFGIELLGLLVKFIGRRDYGDPTHQLVDFMATNTGSDRDKILLA